MDKELHIKKFTPSISKHFQLSAKDIDHSISLFNGTIHGADIAKHAKDVLKNLQAFKKEVKNAAGLWFLMEIYPFRTQKDTIKGVVVSFTNISDSKKALNDSKKANSFLKHLTDSNPAVIYIYDLKTQQNIYSSANIGELAGYTPSEIKKMGEQMLKHLIHPEDLHRITAHHEALIHLKEDETKQIEYRIVSKQKEIIWLLSTDKIYEKDKLGNAKSILGVALITTISKKMESELKKSEERFRLAIAGTGSGLWEWSDLNEDKAWWSYELYNMLGYSQKELKPSFSALINLIHPEQVNIFRKGLEIHVDKEVPFEEEVLVKTKAEGYKWFRVNGQMQLDEYNNAKKIVGTLLNICLLYTSDAADD